MKKILTIGAICGALVWTGSVQAVMAQDSTSASLEVRAGASSTSSEAKGNVEYEWKVEEGEKAGPALMEIDTIRGESPETKLQESGEKGGTEDINIGVGELQGNAVSVSAVEVRGWDPKQKQEFLATVKTHAEVRSEQDLENFAKGVLVQDENVEDVAIGEEGVQIRYRMPAKFLGIFNASLAVRTEVDAEGRVKVRFPWFGFLYAKSVSAAELETEVSAALPEVGDEVLVSFEAQAQTVTTVSNVLKTKHDTVKNSINNVR